ncbi:phosphoinositide phosphatase SAC8 [Selaginella moellendorffii]|uniref:phosphoinositide phosphatase SAC8 n=1 Tax=Selaginella moellendorffii TaxID=88036 RepID=UPI000D1CF217|nr:phosphoinositide phosphatase SAC8 [Selaginella moellendorffii]|eukprot:XP_024545683.1 phosphoinositide phosphatase SAC8 [Selaginella moellendorffii]
MVADVNLSPPGIMVMEREMAQFSQLPRLCASMRLLEFPERYVFEPMDGPHRPLSFDRVTGEASFVEVMPIDQDVPSSTIYGILGMIRLLAGTYIFVITSRDEAGTYRGVPIFRVSSMRILECNAQFEGLGDEEKKDEVHFLGLLKSVEASQGLYFSFETDLTLTTQLSPGVLKPELQSLWKMADPRFLWNRHLLEELIERKLEPYILPVIQGSYQTMQILIGDKLATIALLSRRCIRRIGTRMWRRGANLEGYAANFVETEQILEVDGYTASYVQVRGSIPVVWEQIVDLTYKPTIRPLCLDETPKVVERHFRDISKRYGSVVAVDLIDQQGSEGVLSLAYANAMQRLVTDKLRYVQFDFHRICGHIHFERLSVLYEDVKNSILEQRFFLANATGDVVQIQLGVIRTNCVDCLDRTNVTQSLFGRKALETQLRHLGVFKASDTIHKDPSFDAKFKAMWANHGDEISIQYSGTPALKGDFVRYGKRTVFGLIRDGFNALARYFYNNFTDGVKQDAMDLVAGHYTAARNKPSPFKLNGLEALAYLPFASAVMLTGLTMTTVSLRQVGQDIYQFFYSVVWAGLTASTMALVKANGRQFCNRPRLCALH